MHLLVAAPGTAVDETAAVDLGQSAGEIVVLTAADSEIALLADAHAALRAEHGARVPSLRLANWLRLRHNLSVDLHVERTLAGARLVIVRLLGGRSYWPYGVDRIVAACRESGAALALLPGDGRPDAELAELSTLPADELARLARGFDEGGAANARALLARAATLTGFALPWAEPDPLPRAGRHRVLSRGRPVAGVVFYRALMQAGDLAAVDALIDALDRAGLDPHPIFVASLKDPAAAAFVRAELAAAKPDVIVNLTGFAVGEGDPLAAADCPVLQAVLAAGDVESWREGKRGLAPRDVAMSVALPELDGRVLAGAIGFKGLRRRDDAVEADIVGSLPEPSRVAHVAALAASWVKLRRTKPAERRIALVLANYPTRDGRLANGVGLDTPASVIEILRALAASGHRVEDIPADGDALMRLIQAGPTNEPRGRAARTGGERYRISDFLEFSVTLPVALRDAIAARWGAPEADPWVEGDAFRLPVLRFGEVVVAIQPARGYDVDPAASAHDPDLVPPHAYLAFYAWLRRGFDAHAIVHVGKHGNLEWLPGKSIALSESCFPEAALGAIPHLYPFIVNDPGEGAQAKRRAAAVVVDHLTPPLARAGAHGPGAALERLIDEYHEAAAQDPRRCRTIARAILDAAEASGIARDCGIAAGAPLDAALARLDGFLCELKDLQIRDGLHVFGRAPTGAERDALLLAIARSPRGTAPEAASLTRALAADLGLAVDPLASEPGPEARAAVDRVEALALDLVAGRAGPEPGWMRTRAALDWTRRQLAPAVDSCGAAEIAGLLAGLDGRRVAPGPSGAPTRGRPDALPTGRNFFSVDVRAVPTPSAWILGWASATALLERHLLDHGDHLRVAALSAWGTSCMRTGGDDVAQALALLGARPTWDAASQRVTGFEILPLSLLDRPRVDVTLRVSGLFRDAFVGLVELFDAAARAVAALDEPAELNPLAARVRREAAELEARGVDPADARRRAGARVFGPKPGAYGAGLQALIDSGAWRARGDLAGAFLAWGGWRYGAAESEGEAARDSLERRLARVEAVIHNQDNREHDLLDSDDYYQFEGGLAAAVETLSGRAPAIWHVDHSLPEQPRPRALAEEIARIVRGRATNPRWIAGCRRHGYKGAFEMAATVDYLFAFAATTDAVRDHHFDALHDAYIADPATRAFLERSNPAALREMAARFLEALDRGLWRAPSNELRPTLHRLASGEVSEFTAESAEDAEAAARRDGP